MTEIIVAALALIGTTIGSLAGIRASNKLVVFRLEQLEQKVNKHNNIIERVYKLEGQMTEAEHDIRDLKHEV